MLFHLYRRAAETVALPRTALLATYGPADIQAAELLCVARGLRLYLLLPQTSDLLFNIENRPAVVINTSAWQVQGRAHVLDRSAWPPGQEMAPLEQAQWEQGQGERQPHCLIEVRPTRLHIFDGPNGPETLDFDNDVDLE